MFLPLLTEEILHQLGAFVGKDATDAFCLGVQGTGRIVMEATLGVGSTIDDAGHLGPADGTGTHHTGLHGDIEGTVGEILPTQLIGCDSDGLHLGMGSRIGQGFREIIGTGYHLLMTDNDGSDRYLTLFKSFLSFSQSQTHVVFV